MTGRLAQAPPGPLEWTVFRTRPGARLPTKAHPVEDAGWDLYYAAETGREDEPAQARSVGDSLLFELGTGLEMAFSPGWFFKIEARSGWARQHGVQVLAGVVDSGYRGEVVVLLRVPLVQGPDGASSPAWTIRHGDKIAQGVFLPVPIVTPVEVFGRGGLATSVRQEKGWGSSG